MNRSIRSRLRPLRHVMVVTVVALAAVLLAAGPAVAVTVDWEGQGTNEDGTCENVTGSGNLQTWHFVLTNPDPGPWTLTATFTDSGTLMDDGEQQGGGAVFFFVTTSAGDTLEEASATNGSANSVLTVSDCELSEGPPSTTTPPTTAAPPTTAPKLVPPAPRAPQAPAAVQAVPRVTG